MCYNNKEYIGYIYIIWKYKNYITYTYYVYKYLTYIFNNVNMNVITNSSKSNCKINKYIIPYYNLDNLYVDDITNNEWTIL